MMFGNQVIVDGKTYELQFFKGKVMSSEKRSETKISGGGSTYKGTGSSYVTSSTTLYQDIFLQSADGREKHLKLVDWDIPCREGNTVSALWFIKQGAGSVSIFCVINHTINQELYRKPKDIWSDFFSPEFLISGWTKNLVIILMSLVLAVTLFTAVIIILPIWFWLRSAAGGRAKKFLQSEQIRELVHKLKTDA